MVPGASTRKYSSGRIAVSSMIWYLPYPEYEGKFSREGQALVIEEVLLDRCKGIVSDMLVLQTAKTGTSHSHNIHPLLSNYSVVLPVKD
jgi:hypothetical protein